MTAIQIAGLAYLAGAIIAFILVLVEAKREERPGISKANTFGILLMTPLWPFMLGGWLWRRPARLRAAQRTPRDSNRGTDRSDEG